MSWKQRMQVPRPPCGTTAHFGQRRSLKIAAVRSAIQAELESKGERLLWHG
jgi:hypothetical protein